MSDIQQIYMWVISTSEEGEKCIAVTKRDANEEIEFVPLLSESLASVLSMESFVKYLALQVKGDAKLLRFSERHEIEVSCEGTSDV